MIRPDLPQLLVVCAAFFTLSLLSYFYASNVMKKQVDLYSRSEMQVHHTTIRALLNAHEAALSHAAAAVVYAMENGAGPKEIQALLKTMGELFSSEKDTKGGFESVYGFIKGNYLDGTGWIPGEFFYAKSSPWIRGAVLTGELFHTEPYVNPRNNNVVASVSMVIFDSKGESLGVLAVDYLLNAIVDEVEKYTVTEAGYRMILDNNLNIISSPFPEYKNRSLSEYPGFHEAFLKLSKDKPAVRSQDPMDYWVETERVTTEGTDSMAFFSILENGWYVGVVVPYLYYYSEVYRMIPVISLISFIMALIVCVILVRMSLAKRRSEDESHAKTTFLARMSHEIRTPMNAIMGMCELARRNMGRPEAMEYLGEIRHAGADLLSIINDILDYTKINTGKIFLSDNPYNTANLFYDTLAIIKVRLGTKEIDLNFEIDPQLPARLIGDEVRVRQLILNLLTNAVKYTPQGFIKFGLGYEKLSQGVIKLVIKVADSGVGIKKEDLGALFEDFVRLNQAAGVRHIEGTGLGLAITRSLCLAMGGDIKVESDFGKGTVFTAIIVQKVEDWKPVGILSPFDRRVPVGLDQEEEDLVPFIAPGLPVLVVDDIQTNLVVTKGLLSPYGLSVTTSTRGAEAVELSKTNSYDLIFIDHMMPEMDGTETMKRIKESSALNRDTPMIALTAAVMAGMEEMFLSKGFDDFLGKPIELKNLNAVLERWVPLGKRQAPDARARKKEKAPGALGFDIDGVNTEEGLMRIGGSKTAYLKALSIFCKDVTERLLLFSSVSMENKEDFRVMVHAVKSASANIGAGSLSKEAKLLEDAAGKGDLYTIRCRYPNFQRLLSVTVDRITRALAQAQGGNSGSGGDGNADGILSFEGKGDGRGDGSDGKGDGADGRGDGADGKGDGADGKGDGSDGKGDGADGRGDGSDGRGDGADGKGDGADGRGDGQGYGGGAPGAPGGPGGHGSSSHGRIHVEREILLSLKEAIESRDIGSIDRILDSLSKRRNDKETQETIERISNHVLLADYDEAGLLVEIHLTRENAYS
jgi:signal transduction histidine kinase/DNA-binding response OmpR family regulator